MTTTPPPASADLFDNPTLYGRVVQSYQRRAIATGVALTAGISALASVASALWGRPTTEELGLSWALVAALVPLMLVAGAHLRARRREAFHAVYLAQSVVQFVWMQQLCWAEPRFVAVGAGLFCVWAFHDAGAMYATPRVHAQYLLAPVAFDLVLLAVDALGGRGILHAWNHDPDAFQGLVVGQVALVFVTQALVWFAGTQSQMHDARVAELAARERELAVATAERDALRRASVFLVTGLKATQFCHDINNPLTSLLGNLELLDAKVRGCPTASDVALAALDALPDALRRPYLAELEAWEAGLRAQLANCTAAGDRVWEMTKNVAQRIRNPETFAPRDVAAVLDDAIREMRPLLGPRAMDVPAPSVSLAPCELPSSSGHVATLANLLANAGLQRTGVPVEVTGGVAGPYYYHLTLRDRGVSADARPAAIEKIQRSLSLAPSAPDDTSGARLYAGYGIALRVARVFFSHAGAALAVTVPTNGDGVAFHVLLPRIPFEEIPVGDNEPERVLADRLAEAT